VPADRAPAQRPQARVYHARLALLLHDAPTLDNVTASRQLGEHENWASEGFRLIDKLGRGPSPRFPSLRGGDGQGAGLRAAGAA
jgi:hypothetical protein